MSSVPWMPLYVADYRAATAHLSTVEHGAYMLLIMHYWTAGELPDNDTQLAQIVGTSKAKWKKIRPVIEKFFEPGWRHARIDKELEKAKDIIEKRRHAAVVRHSKSHAHADAHAPQVDRQPPSPSPSPSPSPRGSRLSAEWQPSQRNIADAKKFGLTDRDIERQARRFRDWWLSKSGPNAVKRDWDATWRNWCDTEAEKLGRTPVNAASTSSLGVLVKQDTPAWNAWQAYLKRTTGQGSLVSQRYDGWHFPSEFPPNAPAEAA